MNYCNPILIISLSCWPLSEVFANDMADFSKIEEEMLLNPTLAGSTSDKVIIYSRVRNKTINQAMDSQFHRIGNMMFVNTIVESENGEQFYADDDDCD